MNHDLLVVCVIPKSVTSGSGGEASDHWGQSKRIIPPQPHLSLVFHLWRGQGQNKLGKDANEGLYARQQGKYVWEKIYFGKQNNCMSSESGFSYSNKSLPWGG